MKAKVVVIVLLTCILIGLASVVTVMGLAIVGPLDPGQGLFSVQNWAEHQFLTLLPTTKGQAQFGLQLLERRIQDLAQNLDTPDEGEAYLYVSNEIIHVLDLFKKISVEDETEFRIGFTKELDALLAVLDGKEKSVGLQSATFSEFRVKIQELKNAAENLSLSLRDLSFGGALKEVPISSSKGSSMTLVLVDMESQIIPFPSGSAGAKHLFYPLDGKHSELTCLSCHSQGNYKGTSNLCTDCHLDAKPEGHFSGQCVFCHTTTAWLPSIFDHQVGIAVDCQNCHLSEMPANHYQGQCSACHTTTAWSPAAFDHQTVSTALCQNCHAGNKPVNHYNGECSACHSIAGWLPASFNHQAAGATDCQACHATVRPVNHFSGQCSDCHSTSGWKPASFNHSFPTDHGGTNGVCAECHTSGDSSWTCFTCHNESEMTKKHNEEGIADYVVRCMECHGDGRKHDD